MEMLSDFAAALRSSNADGTWFTFDVMFKDQHGYDTVKTWGGITPELIAELYGIAPKDVHVYWYPPALCLKISVPRPVLSGNPDDTDIDGKQQHAPLLSIAIGAS
jgi:Domain of unknown function (DUF4387)